MGGERRVRPRRGPVGRRRAGRGAGSRRRAGGLGAVEAPLGGSLWKMLVKPGDRIEKGAVIAVIEAMKAECDVSSPAAGVVTGVYARENQAIAPGAALIALAAG